MYEQVEPRRFSFTAVWSDTTAMLRANGALLAAIAGVFLFLPSLLGLRFSVPMDASGQTPDALVEAWQAYYAANWYWMLIDQVFTLIGIAAITVLLLAEPRITVGAALRRGALALPFYLILSLISNFAIGFGLFLFLVPGIYLIGRFSLAHAVLLVERPAAPLGALTRSWTLTGRHGWAAAGLIIIVALAAGFIGLTILYTVGSVILITAGREGIGALLLAFLGAAIQTATQVVTTALYAAIYRAIAPRPA